MDLDELKKLIESGESESVEFKKTTAQQRQGTKTVCAMLNTLGGCVFYGIDDKGSIKGQVEENIFLDFFWCYRICQVNGRAFFNQIIINGC